MSAVDNEDGFLLPQGYFRPYKLATNEMEGVALDDDPFAIRLGKIWNHATSGTNLAKISGNKVRDDGVHDEVSLIRFRMAANRVDGAIELVCTRNGVEVPVAYFGPREVILYQPIFAPAMNIGTAGSVVPPDPGPGPEPPIDPPVPPVDPTYVYIVTDSHGKTWHFLQARVGVDADWNYLRTAGPVDQEDIAVYDRDPTEQRWRDNVDKALRRAG